MATETKAGHFNSQVILLPSHNPSSRLCRVTPEIFPSNSKPGPLHFDTEHFDGKFPNFTLNPYSWTKQRTHKEEKRNMATERKADHYSSQLQLLLVLVLGTSTFAAFSQSIVKSLPGYPGDLPFKLETGYVSVGEWNDVHLFYYFIESEGNPREDPLILWLTGGPGCSSFSGLIFEIGNFEVGAQRQLKLQGYILGNPVTSQHNDKNARIEYAHRLALLSDKLYESIKHNCRGEYVTIDPNNAPCIMDLTLVTACLANLDYEHILEPYCNYDSNNSSKLKWDRGFIQEEPTDFLLLPVFTQFWCRYYNYYVQSDIWANDERVRQALHIRKGTKDKWQRCNDSMAYTEVVFTSLDYHRNLSHTSLRALIYSGDHDLKVPYFGTHKWIESLGLTVDEEWRPWFVDGQNAGYSMRYIRENVGFRLRFATVKGAGHTAPAYKPKETFGMIERWLAFFNL